MKAVGLGDDESVQSICRMLSAVLHLCEICATPNANGDDGCDLSGPLQETADLLGAKDKGRLKQLLDREIPQESANLLDKNLVKEVEWASR